MSRQARRRGAAPGHPLSLPTLLERQAPPGKLREDPLCNTLRFLAYAPPRIPAREHFDSPQLVARLNLPNMAYGPEDKLAVCAHALRGLTTLEPDPERRVKYLDFIDIYAALDENGRYTLSINNNYLRCSDPGGSGGCSARRVSTT
jgi:hypothetical protein